MVVKVYQGKMTKTFISTTTSTHLSPSGHRKIIPTNPIQDLSPRITLWLSWDTRQQDPVLVQGPLTRGPDFLYDTRKTTNERDGYLVRKYQKNKKRRMDISSFKTRSDEIFSFLQNTFSSIFSHVGFQRKRTTKGHRTSSVSIFFTLKSSWVNTTPPPLT